MAYTQDGRLLAIDTPLDPDVLLLQSLTGYEAISRLFRFDLDLVSEDAEIDPDDLVGKDVTIRLRLADDDARVINGYVSRFVQAESDGRLTHYRAEVVPWLWFLTRTADCRIFQNLAAPDILTKIFQDLAFTDFRNALQGSYPTREYCVQYRETDFNFVSRLMEQYGIFYFFEHEESKHTLVLADAPSAHSPCPAQSAAHCDFTLNRFDEEDLVTAWHVEQELRAGRYALTDFNFETPNTDLTAAVASTLDGASTYEIFDYPGEYLKKADGDQLAKVRMQEQDAARLVVNGTSTCRAFTAGFRFDLEGHYRRDLNQPYVLTAVRHAASVGSAYESAEDQPELEESYSNDFTCIPHSVPYRAPRVTPKPVVQGVQTAIVVGPSGEEIHTDKYGRLRVQFHWDREGAYDEKSSCWMRVAQSWAGKRWGSMFLPRIGQEVIVKFLEGDLDQPIIAGRVCNAEQMPPYALPGEQTKSTINTYSSKGGGGVNALRLEDKKGSEQLFLYAQRQQDVRVKEDSLEWVGQDRHLIVAGNQFEEVRGNKHLKVKSDHNEQIEGTLSLKLGTDLQEKVEMKAALDAGMEIHLKAGMNVVIEGGMSITLKAGAAFVVIGPAGVSMSGTPIMLNSGGSAGSGSGASPEAPQAPKEADKTEAGAAADLPPPKEAPVATGPSPQAAALRQAATTGAPFCEKCAEAAREAALARGATPEEAEEAAQAAGIAGAEAEEAPAPEDQKEKTFVAIQLVDEQGQPVSGVRYVVTLPDGTPREGVTDADGKARIDDIDPGTCKISFPDIDGHEWSAA